MSVTALKLLIAGAFLTGISFAQSAKEMNVKLRESLKEQNEVYKSQLKIRDNEALKQDSIRKESESLYSYDLKKLFVGYSNTLDAAENCMVRLTALGHGWQIADSVRAFKVELNRISELTALTVNRSTKLDFDLESVDYSLSDIDKLSLKKQNEALSDRIEQAVIVNGLNKKQLEKQKTRTEELQSFNRQIRRLLADYAAVGTKVEALHSNIYRRIRSEGDRYRKTGLKDIPKEYHQAYKDEFDPRDADDRIAMSWTSEKPLFKLTNPNAMPEELKVLDVVEEAAEFPGGKVKLNEYLMANTRIPPIAYEFGISAKAYVKFVVSETGEISDVKIIKGVPDCPECDAEAIRLVKAMPKWIPGKNNGKPVSMYYNLPITFDAR